MEPKTQTASPLKFSLPVMVAGPADVGRLMRELKMIDDSLLQLSLRAGGTAVKMPKTSQLMDQTIQLNRLNLLKADERAALQQFLTATQTKAPVLHISFSADPSAIFIEKLMAWLRQEIHPQVLLAIGLQPNIGAGCIVRGTNKYFDLSLRQTFTRNRELLLKELSTQAVPQEVPA